MSVQQAEQQVARLLAGGKKARTVRGTVTATIDGTHASVWLAAERRTATCHLPVGMAVAVDYDVLVSISSNTHTVVSILSAPWVTTGITAASGWALTIGAYRVQGGMVAAALKLDRTGSDITVSGAGNFANVQIATLPAAIRTTGHPLDFIPFSWISTVCGGGGHLVPSTGVLTIDDAHSSGSLGSGDDFWLQVIYPL